MNMNYLPARWVRWRNKMWVLNKGANAMAERNLDFDTVVNRKNRRRDYESSKCIC